LAATGGVVPSGRRRGAVVSGELVLVPTPEKVGPRLVVVGEEAWLPALLVTESDEHRVDLRLEGGPTHR
jgi:hypothetical protein